MVEKLQFVNMTTGSDIIETLSKSLYSNIYYVFDELISNAYDGDAKKVSITLKNTHIAFEDDGEGMDYEGIKNFFALGYSPKKNDRVTTKFKRRTIGKFGIGKLTTSNVCDKFEIQAFKNGNKIIANVDYRDLRKTKYLHDYQIPIVIEKCDENKRGTKVILSDIKHPINEILLRRRIIRTMPLNPTFKVVLNGLELRPEDIISGDEYELNFNGKNIGPITGKATISNKKIEYFAGIYIKVNGRVVNADDPNWMNIGTTIGYAEGFATRLYCVVNADMLDSCILANRNEFKKDDPLFLEFQMELKKELSKLYRQVIKSKDETRIEEHSKIARAVIDHQINKMIENTEVPEDFMKIYSERKDSKKIKGVIEKIKRKQSDKIKKVKSDPPEREADSQNPHRIKLGEDRIIKIGKKKFKFKITLDMGKDDPECIFDKIEGVIYINANHPQYNVAQEEGALYCHFRKAIAYEISKTLAENDINALITRYEDMLHADISVIE